MFACIRACPRITSAYARACCCCFWLSQCLQLLVQVRSVEVHDSDAVAAVMDPTGSMLAFLSCRVLDECGPQLRVGSTLLLRGAAVFSPQAGIKYLNITPACVAAVWPAVGGPLPLAATQPAALVE
ncbi:MAG: DUF4539 domain-containing protein [Methanobacteriota archaeon]|nr:MAG: DUF4539 domain-containing protein [Euryarchaeota archaeon]